MKITPRQKIAKLHIENGSEGWYGLPNYFIRRLENELFDKAIKLSNKLSYGMLPSNTLVYKIYNCLLDGISIKKITEEFK